MTIDLTDYEKGVAAPDDYDAALADIQKRLARIQSAFIVRGGKAIILFEGWDAAGKGGIIKRMTADWDPRYFHVWPISAPTPDEKQRHFLWRFWNKLPANRQIAVFDRSWYGRVLVERVEGFASKGEWKRGYDEINAFEQQQHDAGATIVKLFVHVTQDEQDKRLVERIDNPWKRWKTTAEDYRNRSRREDYLKAMDAMFRKTDTKVAPWQAIDGNTKKGARIAALTYIADRLEAAVSMKPPANDPEVLQLAREAFGERIEVGG